MKQRGSEMLIQQLQENPIILQLVFTNAELQNSLFTTTLNKMYNGDDYDANKKGNDVTVTNLDANTFQVLGESIDEIRELWCGDVIQDADKDLSKRPQFILGDYDKPVDPNPEP